MRYNWKQNHESFLCQLLHCIKIHTQIFFVHLRSTCTFFALSMFACLQHFNTCYYNAEIVLDNSIVKYEFYYHALNILFWLQSPSCAYCFSPRSHQICHLCHFWSFVYKFSGPKKTCLYWITVCVMCAKKNTLFSLTLSPN